MVPMRLPASGLKINFHVAGARWLGTNLHNRSTKIRPGFAIMKARMKDAHIFAVQGPQFVAKQSLMLPDDLEETFRWKSFAVFAQPRCDGAGAKLGIGIV